MKNLSRAFPFLSLYAFAAVVSAQIPNHPIITEVFTDPSGVNDGPFGRDVTNAHQEYIEIYLPPAASLAAGLNKDALRLTFYEVEGDSSSSGLGLINYRFDLPTFDLDSSNGLTAGAIARPSSGVAAAMIPIAWVIERYVIRRLYGKGLDYAIIATYAVLLIGTDIIKMVWGSKIGRAHV